MKNVTGHLFPETALEIDDVCTSRQERASHPQGRFDNGGRWYPSEDEMASCCRAIRSPSRAHPYSYMVHCRTRKHIATWFAEHAICIRCGARLDALERVGSGRTCNTCLSRSGQDQPTMDGAASIGLGAGFGFALPVEPVNPMDEYLNAHPTTAQLEAWRLASLEMALASYKMEHSRHPRDIVSRAYWSEARRYWTVRAYQYHGYLLSERTENSYAVAKAAYERLMSYSADYWTEE